MSGRQLGPAQAAEYLHMQPIEIIRLVRQGEIPFSGDTDRPLFREEELDGWASRRILGMNDRRLGEFVGGAAAAHAHDGVTFSVASLLAPERVFLSFQARTKASVISEMVRLADEIGLLYDPKELVASLREREDLCSTGLPGGFAILHPRHHDPYLSSESFLLLARTSSPVPFGAPDGKPTDLFLTLVCHEDRMHLRALAGLCMAMSNPELVSVLRESDSPEEICAAMAAATSRK